MAEHGREARFPYLDEDVMALLRALPMRLVRPLGRGRVTSIAARFVPAPTPLNTTICNTTQKFDLEEPRGIGDKKLLRHVAGVLLGLEGAARLVKRAIQFGSRIAREANTHNFGSHRSGKQTRWSRKASGAAWGVPAAEAAVEPEEGYGEGEG